MTNPQGTTGVKPIGYANIKAFYFGCVRQAGHYMHAPNLISDWDFCEHNPWGYKIDAGLCPAGPEIEGRALIHHKDGWTAMAFWDRSVDRRGRCNSAFLAEGTFTFEEMLSIATEKFPSITGRFTFPIVEATR